MTLPETRHSLIVRLKCHDNQPAWQDFVVSYEPFLKRLAARQGVPERHVADVTQQVLLAIARSIDGWTDDGNKASFRRWMSTISRNVVIKFMTPERKYDGTGGSDLLELLSRIPDESEPQLVQRYEHEMIVWAADHVRTEFRDTSWKAFTATVIDGESVSDVAVNLGITPGSIDMSRSRILSDETTAIIELFSVATSLLWIQNRSLIGHCLVLQPPQPVTALHGPSSGPDRRQASWCDQPR